MSSIRYAQNVSETSMPAPPAFLVRKSPGEEQCVFAVQEHVLLSSKFEPKSSQIFTQLPSNITVSCETVMFGLQKRILYGQCPGYHRSRLFESHWVCTFLLGGVLLCLRFLSVSRVLVKSDNPGQEGCFVGGDLTRALADIAKPSRNRIRRDSGLHVKGRKNMHLHPS
jgi:hypothetical protein